MIKKINPDLLLIIVAIIWGTGFIATEYAIDANLTPMFIMAGRFSVASLTLLIFGLKSIKQTKKDELIKGSITGVLLFLGFYFQTNGQSMTTVSNSAFLTATNVVFVPFIAWAISRKKPKTKVFYLALLTFIGVVVLTVNPSGGFQVNSGDVYVFICAIMFASHIAFTGYAVEGNDPFKITLIQLMTATVLAIIGAMFMGIGDVETMDLSKGIPSVIFLGVFSTCLCFFLQSNAQKRTTAGKTGIILSTESFFGTLFSILLGIEPLTLKIIIGGIIILTAVILTEVDFDNFMNSKQEASVISEKS